MTDPERRRLSIDLPTEMFNKLNDLIGDLRIKSQVYQTITMSLINNLENLSQSDRNIFLVSVIDSKVNIEDWCKKVKEAKSAVKG